jgi:four helix bundle protein
MFKVQRTMAAKKFEDLNVWVKSKELSVLIYQLTNDGEFKKDFGLRDQLRRASVSIVSNIAEGFERNGNKEFSRFLSLAKGSAGEIRAQLYISRELKYINEMEFNSLSEKVTEVSKMLSGLMDYLKQTELKGTKYN